MSSKQFPKWLLLSSFLLLNSCGVQFGNGVHGGKTASETTDPAEAAFASAGKTDMSGDNTKKFGESDSGKAGLHLFIAEASPIAEIGSGTLVSQSNGGSAVRIDPKDTSGRVPVRFSGITGGINVSLDTVSGPYAITAAVSNSDTIQVSAISSSANSAGTLTTRSATYSDGFKTQWDIDASGNLKDVRVTNADASHMESYTFIPDQSSSSTLSASGAGAYLFCENLSLTSTFSVGCKLLSQHGTPFASSKTVSSASWSHSATEGENGRLATGSDASGAQFSFNYVPRDFGTVRLELSYADGSKDVLLGKPAATLATWISLNGAPLPANPVLAGTDQGANAYVCRIHANGSVVPGKLLVDDTNTTRTICYATLNGQSIRSNEKGSGSQNYTSDILQLSSGKSFDDVFYWRDAADLGLAAFGGKNAGSDLPICRADDCSEVLVWKNSAVRSLTTKE